MVNPGGTGSPALVISARPAPLPPSTSFILPLPSALPPPNEYTYFVADGLFVVFFSFASASGRVIVAMDKSFFVWSDSKFSKNCRKTILYRWERKCGYVDVVYSVFRAARGAAATAPPRYELPTLFLRSRSPRNPRSSRIPATASAAAPAGSPVLPYLRPLP